MFPERLCQTRRRPGCPGRLLSRVLQNPHGAQATISRRAGPGLGGAGPSSRSAGPGSRGAPLSGGSAPGAACAGPALREAPAAPSGDSRAERPLRRAPALPQPQRPRLFPLRKGRFSSGGGSGQGYSSTPLRATEMSLATTSASAKPRIGTPYILSFGDWKQIV